MLTNDKYQEGLNTLEKTKYNINYCKKSLFNIVCFGLANRLLSSEYSSELTDEQRAILQKIINE